jgi:hypothetical protein
MYTSQPFFSTLKRTERSYHWAVGTHNVTRWTDYTIDTVQWPDGHVTRHLGIVDRINGQVDRVAQLGASDTERKLARW